MSSENIFAEIDKRSTAFIERLREAVEIPSVSAEEAHRDDVFKMINWAQEKLTARGVKCQQIKNREQTLPDGRKIPLPPVLFGTLEAGKDKKTLLVYGHLDVQPAKLSDGWDTDPFKLVEKDGKLFGRGSTDDKGPVIGWINAIEVLQDLKIEIPVNIKFCFEGMEESGSEGLDEILIAHKDTFLKGVDMTCISDNYWLGKSTPCLTYGLRGICYYGVEISHPKQDLHSGVFGGSIHEPVNVLTHLLSKLTDVHGKIKIPGLDKLVAPVTAEEEKLYDSIDFDLKDYQNDIGVTKLLSEDKKTILMNRWRFPSLSLHGIEGAFDGKGTKTVIPSKIIGKFSIRIVPNMTPEEVHRLVEDYLQKEFDKLGSPCKFHFHAWNGQKPWVADYNHPHFEAGARAIEKVFKKKPNYTREGGSIPVTLTFQELTGKNVMLLPMGACDDMAHSQNEKLNVSNYINGTKVLAQYLLELAHL